ncbi:4-hydroxy-4-methyl-2-oxoglutarate aldolase [Pacificibacter maritimus]|uniref:4-hydroxy-4-methyl-2-oxoglutarate aldolase n=1 Tax=Pacificibacter maritimus TaxID=762213 RepID=A0A3N4UNF5_9RHOB|nr:4-carboxy-4-hydroxy-2-oxoadipate aldolase/oxaloacetate decarboxylase [Pacificibacter maritimus]RPE72152.1 4-hydroxy-4-methyl-2-oxoglutarate aldolase [Pacificibacter maritimus]
MVNIITEITRPTAAQVALAQSVTPATIHEAQGRTGAVDPAIQPIKPGLSVCGPAVTVSCTPGDNMMLIAAINVAKPGDVLVVSAGGNRLQGGFGEVLSTACASRGIAGLVIDACVRDGAAIRAMGWPVFSTGLAMQGTVKETLGSVNKPIIVGGILINPGDIVSGDDDGVVCLKREDIDRIGAISVEKEQKEAEMMDALRAGADILELSGMGQRLKDKGCISV